MVDPSLIIRCAKNREIPDFIKEKAKELCEDHRDFSSVIIYHILWSLYPSECNKSTFTKIDMINYVNRCRRERSDSSFSQASDLIDELTKLQSSEEDSGLFFTFKIDGKHIYLNLNMLTVS